jgi:hypothetical protein
MIEQTSYDVPLYAVCSNDYFECDRDPKTTFEDSNGVLKLWSCANTSQEVWDKRIYPVDRQNVIFSGAVVVGTKKDGRLIVGRQDYRDVKTGARDTINLVTTTLPDGCVVKRLYSRNTYIWDPEPVPDYFPWYWIDIWKEIIFFDGGCPDWLKEQIIKIIWIDWSPPPKWWLNPGLYAGHDDIYFGYFADLDAPFDTGCQVDGASQTGCNSYGYDAVRKMVYQSGYWNGFASPAGHPEYDDYYLGLALTNRNGAVVDPYNVWDVRNDSFLYPNSGWGWKDSALYDLMATPGVNMTGGDTICDRSAILTALKIPAGTDTTFTGEFILIEAFIPGNPGTGLDQLQAHMDQMRAYMPTLRDKNVFLKPICGDVNCDGAVTPADVLYLINYLFIHGPAPCQPYSADRGDVNKDGAITPADVLYLINYLFIHGPPPKCPSF